MRNVEITPSRKIRFPKPDAEPLRGWALRLTEDIPEVNAKRGFWIADWSSTATEHSCEFIQELVMVFNKKEVAERVCKLLEELAEIRTEVVAIGNPAE